MVQMLTSTSSLALINAVWQTCKKRACACRCLEYVYGLDVDARVAVVVPHDHGLCDLGYYAIRKLPATMLACANMPGAFVLPAFLHLLSR
eukprot:363970-Chlamydomonas_euryale.AAC.16